MNQRFFSSVCLFCIIAAGSLFVSCKSAPKAADPDFLGNYPPRQFEPLMGNTIDQGKNDLTPREVKFVFYPMGNAVQMKFRYSISNINITLLQKDREAMITAMKKYIDEYQNGKLTDANNKKKAYFGKTQAFLMWGLLAPTNYAKPDFRFEYQIVSTKKPYFVIGNASSSETDVEGYLLPGGGNSPAIRVAFSPIQCQNIIEMLNQEALLKVIKDLDAEAALFDIPADAAAAPAADGTALPAEPKELF